MDNGKWNWIKDVSFHTNLRKMTIGFYCSLRTTNLTNALTCATPILELNFYVISFVRGMFVIILKMVNSYRLCVKLIFDIQ